MTWSAMTWSVIPWSAIPWTAIPKRRGASSRSVVQAVVRAMVTLTLVLSVLAIAVPDAHAQRRVKDGTLRSRTADENKHRITEMSLKLWELEELVRQAEGLAAVAERAISVRDVREAVDVYIRAGNILGYGTSDVELLYDEIMVAASLPGNFQDYLVESATVLLTTYQNLLLAIQEQMQSLDSSQEAIGKLRTQLVQEVDTEMKALQLQSAVELLKAEELMLLRQALAIQANAQSIMGAYNTNQSALRVGITQRALSGN